VTVTDSNGDVLCRDSAGTIGFKGARKSTPFAAQRAAEASAVKARKMGITQQELDEAAWCAVAMGGAPVRMFYQEQRPA
jgi:ribosomal protein S11